MALPNRMSFRKSSNGGRGSFSIRKFLLQILDLYKGLFSDVSQKELQYNFSKMGGGQSKAVWNFPENSSDLVPPSFPKEGLGLGEVIPENVVMNSKREG